MIMAKMYGFKDGGEKPSASYPMLPKGAYVAGIKNIKIDGKAPERQIVIRLDIIEGEYAGYFTKRYEHDKNRGGNYEVKYKGDYKLWIPDPNNTKRDHPEWDASKINTFTYCVNASNPGFVFDGDDAHIAQLKGKIIGISMQQCSLNGIAYTRIYRPEVADDVRQGIVKPVKDGPDRMTGDNTSAPAPATDPSGFTPVEVDTEELPF